MANNQDRMEELQNEIPLDELIVQIIKEEAEKIHVSVDYYIMEFL